MARRRVAAALGAAGLGLGLLAMFGSAAANFVPSSRLGELVVPLSAEDLKPLECADLALQSVVEVGEAGRGSQLVLGTTGGDVIRAGGGGDCLVGGAGDDELIGGGGADVLIGGPDSDDLTGNGGSDRLYGGPGSDALNGGGGTDYCDGGVDADTGSSCEESVRIP